MRTLLGLLLALPACVVPAGAGAVDPTATTAGGGAAAGPDGGGAAPVAAGPAVAVTAAALATAPVVISAPSTPLTSKLRELGISTSCSGTTTAQPIASFELRASIPKLTIQLDGRRTMNSVDGFVLRSGDKVFTACNATNTYEAQALPPGRYEVYPATTCIDKKLVPDPAREGYADYVCNDRITPKVSFYASDMSMPAQGRQEIPIDALARPRFVEVTLAAGRVVMPTALAGQGCERDAYTIQPDVLLDLTSPLEDLVVRVLPTARPVAMRTQTATDGRACRDDGRRFKYEPSPNRGSSPTYGGGVDLVLGDDAEGKVALWLGSRDPTETSKVTLMISDKTTTFEPYARFDGGFPLDTVERRWLGGLFPQLDLTTFSTTDRRHADFVAAAAVFAATPDAALVHVKRDIAAEDGQPALARGEPLAVVGVGEGGKFFTGLTADGLVVNLKGNAVGLTPPGASAYPTVPRPTTAEVWDMLPPAHAPKAAAYGAKFKKLEACRTQAYAPYDARLPKASAGFVIASKSPEYVRIENAGHAAMDSKCGSKAKLEAKLAPELAKLQALVHAERARLLAVALASHAR